MDGWHREEYEAGESETHPCPDELKTPFLRSHSHHYAHHRYHVRKDAALIFALVGEGEEAEDDDGNQVEDVQHEEASKDLVRLLVAVNLIDMSETRKVKEVLCTRSTHSNFLADLIRVPGILCRWRRGRLEGFG